MVVVNGAAVQINVVHIGGCTGSSTVGHDCSGIDAGVAGNLAAIHDEAGAVIHINGADAIGGLWVFHTVVVNPAPVHGHYSVAILRATCQQESACRRTGGRRSRLVNRRVVVNLTAIHGDLRGTAGGAAKGACIAANVIMNLHPLLDGQVGSIQVTNGAGGRVFRGGIAEFCAFVEGQIATGTIKDHVADEIIALGIGPVFGAAIHCDVL